MPCLPHASHPCAPAPAPAAPLATVTAALIAAMIAALIAALIATLMATPTAARAQTQPQAVAPAQPAAERFVGDLGAGVFISTSTVRGHGTEPLVLPYVWGDWGRYFARLDTFGARMLPLGAGHLELVLRYSGEGFKADRAPLTGLSNRGAPLPLGIGTMQRLPVGALFLYALHDVGSGGQLLEGTFGTRLELGGGLKLYPQLGVEHRTAAWVRKQWGVSAAEAAASGLRAYQPGASTVPMLGLAASLPMGGAWNLEAQWRQYRLDGAIRNSPIASRGTQQRGFVAVTHAFK